MGFDHAKRAGDGVRQCSIYRHAGRRYDANVTFSATCASTIEVTGTGTGKMNGATLEWTAQGLVGQGGTNCPFSIPNGKATEETGGGIKVSYTGTVCGIPVSGSEVVKKP